MKTCSSSIAAALAHCLVFSLLLPSVLADHHELPIEGVWKTTATTDDGEKHYTLTIIRDGDVLGGNIVEVGKEGGRSLNRVKVDGKTVSIEIDIESDGQAGVVKVMAQDSGQGALTGKWLVADASGTEVMSGDWEGTKVIPFTLAGTWDSVAELPEGNTLESVLTVTGKPGDYAGEFKSENSTTRVSKLSHEDDQVRIEMAIEREGVTMDVEIKARVDGNDLEGGWYLSDGSGGIAAEGDWKAKKRAEFSLEGSWNVVVLLPEGGEMQATFEITRDGTALAGQAKTDNGSAALKSVSVGEDGEITIALDYEADGNPGLVTLSATADGADALKGTWVFAAGAAGENVEGRWNASRAVARRGDLRGR